MKVNNCLCKSVCVCVFVGAGAWWVCLCENVCVCV